MAFYKLDTKTYANNATGKRQLWEWMISKIITRGWTQVWKQASGTSANSDTFFALSRTTTYSDGTTQDFHIVLEAEYNSGDINYYAFNDTSHASWSSTQTSSLISGNASWMPFYTNGPVQYWEDDSSDAYLFIHQNRIIGIQMPDGGWVNAGPNDSGQYPGTRPYYANLPVCVQSGGEGTFLQPNYGYYPSNAIVHHGRDGTPASGVWTDYCALGVGSQYSYAEALIWVDQQGTWKMEAKKFSTFFNEDVEVVKIGIDYYLRVSMFLLPAGTSEPSL